MEHTAVIEAMKQWAIDNYTNGTDVIVECYEDSDYESLFIDHEGKPLTAAEAWKTLKSVASIYAEREADARNSAF
jgi:site-specific recombinase XerD